MTKKTEGNKRSTRGKSVVELNDLRNWLAGIGFGVARSAVHVNGHQHPSAIVTVDIGQPLKQVRLTSEQSQELGQRLRRVAKEALGKDVNIRVQQDNSHGVHWASLA